MLPQGHNFRSSLDLGLDLPMPSLLSIMLSLVLQLFIMLLSVFLVLLLLLFPLFLFFLAPVKAIHPITVLLLRSLLAIKDSSQEGIGNKGESEEGEPGED